MPRLLLVDDNPSIHKIAETLLAGSDVSLVCAASGAEALSILESEGPFEVALIDISMMGMDGWELLSRIRGQEATACMPVGMMAGVLDVVDPGRLQKAPIQGFFKKPVELRDLPARIRTLLETPVEPPAPEPEESPLAPEAPGLVPDLEAGEPVTEILQVPGYLPPPEGEPAAPSPYRTVPAFRALERQAPEPPAPETRAPEAPLDGEDILQLGPEDLFTDEESPLETPEEPAPDPAAGLLDETLDLEELDMDSLRNLTQPVDEPGDEPLPQAAVEDLASVPDFSAEDTLTFLPGDLPSGMEETAVTRPDPFQGDAETAHGLLPAPLPQAPSPTPEAPLPADFHEEAALEPDFEPDFEPAPTPAPEPEPAPAQALDPAPEPEPGPIATPLPEPPSAATPEDFLDWTDESETLLEAMPTALDEAVPPPLDEVPMDAVTLDLDAPEPEPENRPITLSDILDPGPPMAAPLAEALPAPMAEAAHPSAGPVGQADPLAALLADPVLMDRLAKAVVSRLGDQTLREIAWEVMPELADRLHRG